MADIEHVPPHFVDREWRTGAHHLSKACDASGGEVTGDQLKLMLMRGERALARIVKDGQAVGWIALRIDQLPNVRALHVCELYAPGAMFEECWGQLKGFAAGNGCTEIRCAAKEAQARLYRMRFGFEPVYTTLRVSL